LFLEALGNALDHIKDERSHEAVQGPSLFGLDLFLNKELMVFELQLDEIWHGSREMPTWSFDPNLTIFYVNFYVCGKVDGLLTDTRHHCSPYQT
jgi:hypothetical protein